MDFTISPGDFDSKYQNFVSLENFESLPKNIPNIEKLLNSIGRKIFIAVDSSKNDNLEMAVDHFTSAIQDLLYFRQNILTLDLFTPNTTNIKRLNQIIILLSSKKYLAEYMLGQGLSMGQEVIEIRDRTAMFGKVLKQILDSTVDTLRKDTNELYKGTGLPGDMLGASAQDANIKPHDQLLKLSEVVLSPEQLNILKMRKILPVPLNPLILYGPPGSGKTMFAEAIASSMNCDFKIMGTGDIIAKYLGEAEKNVRNIFEMLNKNPNLVILLDEAESVLQSRTGEGATNFESIVQTFLIAIDEAPRDTRKRLIFATNIMPKIDRAIVRRLTPMFLGYPQGEDLVQTFAKILADFDIDDQLKNFVDQGKLPPQLANEITQKLMSLADISVIIKRAFMEKYNRACRIIPGEGHKNFKRNDIVPNAMIISEKNCGNATHDTYLNSLEQINQELYTEPLTERDLILIIGSWQPTITRLEYDEYSKYNK